MPQTLQGTVIDPLYKVDAHYQELRYRLQKAHNRAKQCLEKSKIQRKQVYDKATKPIHFKPGDVVVISNENHNQFDPWYKGPFPIVTSDNVNCTIKDEKGKCTTLHKNRVHPYDGVGVERK